jgi:hypothetical protein
VPEIVPANRQPRLADHQGLPLLHEEDATPVGGAARLGLLLAQGALFAVGDEEQAARRDALTDQVVRGGAGAALAERQVVLAGAAVVAVALDENDLAALPLEPVRDGIEDLRVARADARVIEVEADVPERAVAAVFLRRRGRNPRRRARGAATTGGGACGAGVNGRQGQPPRNNAAAKQETMTEALRTVMAGGYPSGRSRSTRRSMAAATPLARWLPSDHRRTSVPVVRRDGRNIRVDSSRRL